MAVQPAAAQGLAAVMRSVVECWECGAIWGWRALSPLRPRGEDGPRRRVRKRLAGQDAGPPGALALPAAQPIDKLHGVDKGPVEIIVKTRMKLLAHQIASARATSEERWRVRRPLDTAWYSVFMSGADNTLWAPSGGLQRTMFSCWTSWAT